jgi:nucleoside-diphosphate-sugar epimerase
MEELTMITYPEKIVNEEQLEELLSRPGAEAIEMFSRIDGDLIFLGVSGKIGQSLARMARRACDQAGSKKRIIGVSLFENKEQQKKIEKHGIETIHGDLLDTKFTGSLPSIRNVFFLAGMKFGSIDNLAMTWAINSYLPALVAEHFKQSRIVAFSTGCVYPLVPVESGGSVETDAPVAIGEYAQSCLGRERMFEYGSNRYKTEVALIRLNYSVEMRYGVLVDIAVKVKNNQPVDLAMGHFNVIWQGDMNDFVLRSLDQVRSPAKVLNITGPEILSVREVATQFGKLFGVKPVLVNEEAPTALLSNSGQAFDLYGKPKVQIDQVIKWISEWIKDDKGLLGKPTHFEVRDGKY